MARILWSEEETAILIDAYLQIESRKLSRVEAIQQTSTALRNRAKNLGMEIDDIFRNENGISLQLSILGNAFNNKLSTLSNAPSIFVDMINQYKTNRPYFDKVLNRAKEQAEITQMEQQQTTQQKVSVSLQERFLAWLSAKVSPAQMYDFYMAYVEIEKTFLNSKDYPLLEKPFFETASLKVISEIKIIIDSSSKLKSNYFGSYKKMKAAIQYYYDFLKENEAEFAQNEVEISPVGKISSEKKETEKNTTVEKTKSNLLTIDWNNIENQNLYDTKPLYFVYFDKKYNVMNWSNLYVQVVSCLYQDYASQISRFTNSSLFANNSSIDIADAIHKQYLRRPERIEGNLFLETYLNANNIILRINRLLQLCGINNKNIVTIYYEVNSDKKEKNKKISLNDADEQLLEYIKNKEVDYEDHRAKGGSLWLIGGHELDNFVKACEQRFDITFHYNKNGKKFEEAWWTTTYAKVVRPLSRPPQKKIQSSSFEVKNNVDIKDSIDNINNVDVKDSIAIQSQNNADRQLLEYIKNKEVDYEDHRAKGGCLWLIGGHELDNFVKACEQRFDITFHYNKNGKKFEEAWWTTTYAKVARPLPRPIQKKTQSSSFEVKNNVDMKDNIDNISNIDIKDSIDNTNNIDVKDSIDNTNSVDVKDSITIQSQNNADRQLLEYIKSQNIDYEDLREKGGCLWLIGGRDLDDFVSCCQQRFDIVFAYCEYNINPLELKAKKFKEAWYTLEYAKVARPLPCPISKEVQSSPFEVNIDSINKSDVLSSDNNLSETDSLCRTDNLDDIDDLNNTDNANNNDNFSKTDHLNKTDIEYHIEPKKIPLPIKRHYMVIEKRITLDLDDLLLEDLDDLEELEELETSNTEISHVEINDLEVSNIETSNTETNNSEQNDFEENNVEISHFESDNSTFNDLDKLAEQEQKPENPYEQILTEYFAKGFRKGSYLDIKKFIKYYNEKWNENINADDKLAQYRIEEKILQAGILYEERIFSVDSLASAEMKQKLIDFIQNSFKSGKSVIYYKVLFDEFQGEFSNIYNEEMLKKYLQHILKDYYFKREYFSNQENTSFNLSNSIKEVILDYGTPISIQRIYQAFPNIPEERIKNLISIKRDFIWNKRGEECFHISMFDLNKEELDEIADIITKAISENNSISVDKLFTALENTNIMERFEQYSKIGKRDALAYYLSDKFNFGANIITSKSSAGLQNGFAAFAKKHSTFTIEDLKELKKELGVQEINLKTIYQYAMRINETNFVSKEQANFDMQTTDAAISQYCIGDYVALKEINFAFFPETDFSWNIYLLEQYVAHFSAAYKLINNRYYVEDCVGAIVKKGSNIKSFDELIIYILKNDFFSDDSQEVLNYLCEKGYLARPSYAGIDNIIARVKREKRG